MNKMLMVMLVGSLLGLAACDSGCDGCIDIPPEVTTTTEYIEVPVTVIEYVDREVEVIVEVDKVLMEVYLVDLQPESWTTKRIKVKVKNISNVTLYAFKLSVSNNTILQGFGSGVTYLGNGDFNRGNLVAPSQDLELYLDLSETPTSSVELSVEAK